MAGHHALTPYKRDGECRGTVLVTDLTWLSWILAVFGGYYIVLFGVLLYQRWNGNRIRDRHYRPMICVVVPSHNEEAVIAHTIEALLRQDYEDVTVMVMNDGSKDRTSEIANRYVEHGVMVVDRGPEIAGCGKGAVLNHAYAILCEMVEQSHPLLRGRQAEDVVICVIDADGQLEPSSLSHVAPYFSDPVVGGVQIGVRIANAETNILTRMQDLEFVGFSAMVQEARDLWGAVGLGGNGQFTRLSALQTTGDRPWSDCLTEDLDLGLTLVKSGWKIRFCPTAWVAQQAVISFRPLFRQRTRWIQGHYQCWQHFEDLVGEGRVPFLTRADLVVYLFMGAYIWLVVAGPFSGLLSAAGLISVRTSFLSWVSDETTRGIIRFILAIAPFTLFIIVYQTKAARPFKVRWLPAIGLVFTMYTYTMLISQVWALSRLALGRDAWAKTARVQSETSV